MNHRVRVAADQALGAPNSHLLGTHRYQLTNASYIVQQQISVK